MTFGYLYSKFFKKIIRGTSILNSEVDKTAKVYSGSTFYNSRMGRYSYVGYESEVVNCELGAFCNIANGFIVGGAKHLLDWVSTSPVFYNSKGGTEHHLGSSPAQEIARTVIGNDVWIGSCVIVMPGVNEGTGAIIGAGAVVTKNVPPYAIVAGCPARILQYCFDEWLIDGLLKSKWWLLSDEVLSELAKYADSPQFFLTELDKRGGKVSAFDGINKSWRRAVA